MNSGSSSRNNFSNHHHLQMHPNEDIVSTSVEASSSSELTHSNSLLYSLSIFLKDKVNEVQSLVNLLISPDQIQHQNPDESNSIAITNMSTIIQEIIVTASSMIFTCQQMAIGSNNSCQDHHRDQSFFTSDQNLDWYGDNNYNGTTSGMHNNVEKKIFCQVLQDNNNNNNKSIKCYDIIELDASYLLAKYTHFCQVCGKGFKRDANLRMHMRAHGDEYKTSAALSNPIKNINNNTSASEDSFPRKYSCPQEGCRWNQRHEKFQPLKSMICVKNHYKRSHCPKMYVCKRCNRKQFSVLSDLRTHEKHCGNVKWLCSCGTTFSRKDKLMGHVALFLGHTPALITTTSFNNHAKVDSHQMQLDDS